MDEISDRPPDMTRAQWRERRNICKSTHHRLDQLGLGPDQIIYPGTKIHRITAQADAEWEVRMRELGKEHAVQLERARRVELARRAAAQAVKSPKHVSRIKRSGRRRA
jgi:hypothetical protein